MILMVLWLVPSACIAQEMVGPLRLTEAPVGLVVGDYVGNQVLIVDPETLETIDALPIYTDGTMSVPGKPLSVGWLNDRLYVGEETTGLIQVFSQGDYKENPSDPQCKASSKAQCNKKAAWTQDSASLTVLPVVQPSAIVSDSSLGLLFVASKGEKAVLVMDETGNLIRTIGPGSSTPLGNPQAIALDRDGQRVFVSDDGSEKCSWMGCSRLSAVLVFDYNGEPLGKIDGDTGNAGFKFSRAQGIALDQEGNLFLADSYVHKVMVFSEASANTWGALGILGGKGAAPGQLVLPTGVMTDSALSRIYVANTMRGRIEVFTLEDLVQ